MSNEIVPTPYGTIINLSTEAHFPPDPEAWRFSVCDDEEDWFYEVLTFEDVKPKHQAAVAMLYAAYPDEENKGYAIEGIGSVTNFGDLGPIFYLNDF